MNRPNIQYQDLTYGWEVTFVSREIGNLTFSTVNIIPDNITSFTCACKIQSIVKSKKYPGTYEIKSTFYGLKRKIQYDLGQFLYTV